jgi:hypothetical protein
MQHFIFNLADGDRERARSFLHAKRWVVSREERHRDAIAPGDLVLVFVALTREFVGRAKLETAFLDPMPSDPATSGRAVAPLQWAVSAATSDGDRVTSAYLPRMKLIASLWAISTALCLSGQAFADELTTLGDAKSLRFSAARLARIAPWCHGTGHRKSGRH